MRPGLAASIGALAVLLAQSAHAHRIDEYLQATLLSLQEDRVQASMRLVPGILAAPSVIAEIDQDHDGILSESEKHAYALRVLDDLTIEIDGAGVLPKLIAWHFPTPAQVRDGLGEIQIEYAVSVPSVGANRTLTLADHHLSRTSVYLVNVLVPDDRDIHIVSQRRNEQQSWYELRYQQLTAGGARSPTPAPEREVRGTWNSSQFRSLFDLGMRHIAEGTDHLLFLLALLLAAPLCVSGSRWGPPASVRQTLRRIIGIVTAFTVGHSITLALAALGVVRVPEQPVEALIAASILVSAVHAFRPIFPGKEGWVAAVFGLVHGLAFATVLDRIGLVHWEKVTGILAFNLGIEAMQLVVVASILPSLMLIGRTRAYPIVRIGGAVFAATAAVGWLVERLSGMETPVDKIVNGVAQQALWIAVACFLATLAYRFPLAYRTQSAAKPEPVFRD